VSAIVIRDGIVGTEFNGAIEISQSSIQVPFLRFFDAVLNELDFLGALKVCLSPIAITLSLPRFAAILVTRWLD